MPEKTLRERADALVAYLRSLKDDSGAMARLRAAIIPAQRHRAWPYLANVRGIGNERVEAVAAIFANHPLETEGASFGWSYRNCARDPADPDDATTRRFQRILGADDSALCGLLVKAYGVVKREDIPIDYAKLFIDLHRWEHARVEWARDYFAPRRAPAEQAP